MNRIHTPTPEKITPDAADAAGMNRYIGPTILVALALASNKAIVENGALVDKAGLVMKGGKLTAIVDVKRPEDIDKFSEPDERLFAPGTEMMALGKCSVPVTDDTFEDLLVAAVSDDGASKPEMQDLAIGLAAICFDSDGKVKGTGNRHVLGLGLADTPKCGKLMLIASNGTSVFINEVADAKHAIRKDGTLVAVVIHGTDKGTVLAIDGLDALKIANREIGAVGTHWKTVGKLDIDDNVVLGRMIQPTGEVFGINARTYAPDGDNGKALETHKVIRFAVKKDDDGQLKLEVYDGFKVMLHDGTTVDGDVAFVDVDMVGIFDGYNKYSVLPRGNFGGGAWDDIGIAANG